MILKFDEWHRKTIRHLFYTTSNFVHHFKSIGEFKIWSHSPEMLNSGKNWRFFVPCDLEIWWMILKNNRVPLLYYVKLCASLQIHWWSQTWVTVWIRSSRVKNCDLFVPRDLENWRMTLKDNRAPLLCCFKLCASFHSQWWIQTGDTVRKLPIWVKIDDFLAVGPWNLTDDLE